MSEIKETLVKTLQVELPDEVVETLELKAKDKLRLSLKDDNICIHTNKRSSYISQIQMSWFVVPAGIVSVLFFLFFMAQGQTQIAFAGTKQVSLASMAIVLGVLSGACSFIYFFTKGKRGKIKTISNDIYWRNFPAILLSFVIAMIAMLLFFFWVFGSFFAGVSFDIYTSTFLFFVIVALVNYIMIHVSIALTPTLLTNVVIFTIIAGVGVAMLTNGDAQWWQYNFSFLGTPEATRAWGFNVTLIFSGLLLVALIDYLFVNLQKNYPPKTRRLTIIKTILILVALSFAAVGIFPYNDSPFYQQMHNRVAGFLVYFLIILIAGLRWLLPEVGKEFLKLSYLIATGLVVSSLLWLVVGYFSLTAFELIAFLLAISWLFLLIQKIKEIAENTNKIYEVEIK
ncbi:MAG: DUF998 domain-containing protein [Breznakia sp.]